MISGCHGGLVGSQGVRRQGRLRGARVRGALDRGAGQTGWQGDWGVGAGSRQKTLRAGASGGSVQREMDEGSVWICFAQ